MEFYRFILTFWFIIAFSCEMVAQNLWDAQWVMGYDTSTLDSLSNAILVDFRENPRNITNIESVENFWMEGSNTSLCDKEGNLLLYSNGCYILNSQNKIMQNGEGINPGIIQNTYCSAGGSPLRQGVISVPSPGNDSFCYVFNLDLDQPYLSTPNFLAIAPQRLLYQKIDITQDAGLGAIIKKNQIAVFDTLSRGHIQAVRHQNGQDWWIIVPKSHSNCYFLIPVTSMGVQPYQVKCAGMIWDDNDSGGQVVFSPDGKKYIRFNSWNGLNIFDFNTENGDLSNPKRIMFPNDTINYVSGVAVSPNSRFLYVCARKKIYQFDLLSDEIEESKILIAQWDGYYNPSPTLFYLAALAVDGKIYISNTSSSLNLHVIHNPNCLGEACNLEQHGISLPTYNFASIPNLPHYRTSFDSCISSGNNSMDNVKFRDNPYVYPNPNNGLFVISIPNFMGGKAQLDIFDFLGKRIKTIFIYESVENIDMSLMEIGLYYYKIHYKNRRWNGKILKAF